MRHLGHGRFFSGSGEDDLGNLFASSFFQKDENPTPFRRSSKYDDGQESWTGTPEFSDISTGEVLKLHVGDCITGTGRDGRRRILQF